ncbi:MAG: Rha family transcriptional regulator [Bordetella sp.]|uniref:Rha family transcriptional regulator n=1 Tax=Bordetella sp. TaxID=28081 RepID=UPI003F7B4C80
MMTTNEKGRDSGKSATPTTSLDHTALVGTIALVQAKDEPRIDSRLLAQHLGLQHESVAKTLNAYAADFRELGILRFQIGEIRGRGQPERYVLLNEDQTYLLLTYSRNTRRVRELKVRLVKAFREARQAHDMRSAEYLPTYHALHDEIHALAAGSTHERFVHMNVNKLVNKAAGIEPGQRGQAVMPRLAMLTVAQHFAAEAMHGTADHREGYALAKVAIDRLSVPHLGAATHAQ